MQRNMLFFFLYIIVTVTFFDNFAQLPIMPNYASGLGAGHLLVGTVIAMYSITNMAGNFGAGLFINRFGPKFAIVSGMALAAAAVFSYALVSGAGELLVVRAAHGLAVAVVTPAAFALLADHADDRQRGRQMAFSGAAISIAAMLGPPISGLLSSKVSITAPFYMDSGILLLTAAAAYFLLRAQYRKESRSREPLSWARIMNPGLAFAYLTAMILMFAQGILTWYLPLYAEDLGFNAATRGFLFSSFAAASLMLFLTPANRLSDAVGRFKPIYLGLILVGLATAVMALLQTFPLLSGAMFLFGLGFGLIFPASSALVVDLTRGPYRSIAFGIYYGAFSLGVIISPVLTGWLKDRWEFSPFYAGGIFVALGLVLLVYLARLQQDVERSKEMGIVKEEL